MNIIRVPNINYALDEGLQLLKVVGIAQASRNGPVLRAPGPVATVYDFPQQRVLFNRLRDANPVFHLMEAIWMLAGRNDLQFVQQFSSKIAQYAESNGNFHGAYGYRWRRWFGFNQLLEIIRGLRKDPSNRRTVLTMWDPSDLGAFDKKDLPCNTHIYFDGSLGQLDMTVCNRSNDAVMGAYGANVVHMSMLQELVALAVGLPLGKYTQFSNNFHAYEQEPVTARLLAAPSLDVHDLYVGDTVVPLPLLQSDETFEQFFDDCSCLVSIQPRDDFTWQTEFFRHVAHPLFRDYLGRKDGSGREAFSYEQERNDWVTAYLDWVERRDNKENASV